MGQVDPESVSAINVPGGNPSTVTVRFVNPMPAYQQDPVSYSGDVEVLAPNPPDQCPWPANPGSLGQTTFQLSTLSVTENKQVTVTVHGPNKDKHYTFTITPTS